MINLFTPKQVYLQYNCNFNKFSIHLLEMNSNIKLSDNSTDYFINKNFICLPCYIPSVNHQISHMVEADVEKSILLNWGLKDFPSEEVVELRRFYRKNKLVIQYKKPSTIINVSDKFFFSALHKEIRVRAIQLHLKHYNKTSSVFNILNDPYWRDTAIYKNCGNFKTFDKLQDYAYSYRQEIFDNWSKDKIEEFWKIRLKYIEGYMEKL